MLCSLHGIYFSVPNPGALHGLPLTSLSWSHPNFNDAWLKTLGAQGLPLRHLELDNFADIISGAGLGAMSTLTSLTLKNFDRLEDTVLDEVCGLPLLDGLELVNGNRFFRYDLMGLRRATRLRHLSLEGCREVLIRNPKPIPTNEPEPESGSSPPCIQSFKQDM